EPVSLRVRLARPVFHWWKELSRPMSGFALLGEILLASTLALLGGVGVMMAHHQSLLDHAPKRKPRCTRRGQARPYQCGAKGAPALWRRSSGHKAGGLHTSTRLRRTRGAINMRAFSPTRTNLPNFLCS